MLGGQLSLEVPSTKLPGTAWFIQISDTHLSKFDHLPDRQKLYGDKAGDLRCTLLASRQAACLMYSPSDVQLDHSQTIKGVSCAGSLQERCWLLLSQGHCSSQAT